jgi:arylsulfatase A-like enzyme
VPFVGKMKRALPYLLAAICLLMRDAGGAPSVVWAAAVFLAAGTWLADSVLGRASAAVVEHPGAQRAARAIAWTVWAIAPVAFAMDAFRQAGPELTYRTPSVALALLAAIAAASFAAERLGSWTRESRATMAVVGVPLALLFAWLTESSGTLLSVRPGTELEHLVLFTGSWGLALACTAVEAQARAASDGTTPPPWWVGGLALALGVAVLEVDQRALIDQYQELHLWLGVQGFVLLRIGIEALVGIRADTPGAVGRVAFGLLIFFGVAASIRLSALSKLETRGAAERSAIGRSVLFVVPAESKARPLLPPGEGPPELEYQRFLDESSPLDRPNVLLVTVDALRQDIYPHAPALEAFAARSIRFDGAYAQGSRTAIGMGALLSGRYSANIDWDLWVYKKGNIFPRDQLTPAQIKKWKRKYVHTTIPRLPAGDMLAERIKARGYVTAAIPFAGHNQFFRVGVGFDRGFDTFVDLTKEKWKTPTSARVTRRVLQELTKLEKGERPWFVWTHYYDPHESRGKRPRYEELIGDFDRGFGELIEHLESTGQLDNTIVAVVSDHGEALGEHGHGSHATSLYDEQTRVPMVLWVPGMSPSRIGLPVAAIDLTATLAVLTGSATEHLDGTNLLPLARGDEDALEPRPVFTELHRFFSAKAKRTADIKALRLGDWKLIHNRNKGTLALYNLIEDPDEESNRMSSDPEMATKMRVILETFLARAEAEHPLP